MKNLDDLPTPASSFDLDDLLHPAQVFEHPREVLADPDLTVNEKRAILASWASDACAVEAAPALRCAPGGPLPHPAVSREQVPKIAVVLPESNLSARGGPPC